MNANVNVNLNQTSNFDWIEFLSGRNSVAVRNNQDFMFFKKFLANHSIVSILKDGINFVYWLNYAASRGIPENEITFVYDNLGDGLYIISEEESKDKFVTEPIIASSLIHK